MNFRHLWADITFDMRTCAKYSIGLIAFVWIIFLELVDELFDSLVESEWFRNIVNKTEPAMGWFLKLIYK